MAGAVIYIRVSTKEQTENLSLATQLRACEEYCQREGLTVLHRFQEEGESAKTANRPQLQQLLTFCRSHKGQVSFVVVYNLTRFAREKFDHFALRAHLSSLGIALRSVTEPIDETSTGKLMEGVLAAFAQFDNDVRSDRTRAGMRAALELGRWTFRAPIGYLNVARSTGRSLIHDPERGPLVRSAFELFATGRFNKQQLLKEVAVRGLRTHRGRSLTEQTLTEMLTNRLYVGLIDAAGYGLADIRGDFEPLISEETFYAVQAVLSGRRVTVTALTRNRAEFPLRGFVRCHTCGRPLTASWSRGRKQRYPYYHCQSSCPGMTVAKAKLEDQFVARLTAMQPNPKYQRLVTVAITRAWELRRADASARRAGSERKARSIQGKLDKLDDAFIYSKAIDVATYERQRDLLRQELTLHKIDHHAAAIDELDVEGVLAFAERVLPRAADLWIHATLDQRQRLQAVFFPDGLCFDGKLLVGTAASSSAFSYLRGVTAESKEMVDLTGVNWNQLIIPDLVRLAALRPYL